MPPGVLQAFFQYMAVIEKRGENQAKPLKNIKGSPQAAFAVDQSLLRQN
jgi:hypothetical protein